MAKIHNLGEAIDRGGPEDAVWLIEIGADRIERSFTFGALHRDADGIARGLQKRRQTWA